MIENTDLADSDGDLDKQETDRRTVLRAGGLIATGAVAGLLSRPLANDLAAPDDPIDRVTVDADREVRVRLVKSPSIAGVVIVDDDGSIVADWFHAPAANPLVTDPLDPGEYRALARRGDTPAETETVQEVAFEVTRR